MPVYACVWSSVSACSLTVRPMHRYSRPFQSYADIVADACQYAVIAFATWPEQHTHLMASIMAQKCPGQKFLLLVHNPDLLLHPLPGDT